MSNGSGRNRDAFRSDGGGGAPGWQRCAFGDFEAATLEQVGVLRCAEARQ